MRHEFGNAAEVRTDHGNAGGERLEHRERARLEPLRWNERGIVVSERLDNLIGGDRRVKSDAWIVASEREKLVVVTSAIRFLDDTEQIESHWKIRGISEGEQHDVRAFRWMQASHVCQSRHVGANTSVRRA